MRHYQWWRLMWQNYLYFCNLQSAPHTSINYKLVNRAAMGRVRFMFYPWFIFFFVGDQTKTSALPNFEWRNVWCLFAKSCWNINTWTMLRMLFSLLCVKYIFFWFYRSVGFEENNKYAKNAKKGYYVNNRMRWRCSFHFHYVTNSILQCKQIRLCRSVDIRWFRL